MSRHSQQTIINSSDKSYRRILTGGSYELFTKAFVFFLFQQFNPSTTAIGKKLFCQVNDDEIDISMYREVDPSQVSPGYEGDIILLRVQYNECPGDFEYIKDQGIIYSASIPEKMRQDTDLIDFLLSYKDDEIVTCGNFTTSFLQKLVGLTFGSVRYTQTFLISLFAQFPPCTPTGEKIWHKSECNQEGEQRIHIIYIQDEDGLMYILYSNSRGDTYASDTTEKGYYIISSSILLDNLINSIPECVKFIENYRGELYELNQRMNNFRIKHLMTFGPEMIETDEVLFTCRIPGQPNHTFNGNHFPSGVLTFFDDGYFRIDYDSPSILLLDPTEKPVSSRFGKLAFKPSDWKEDPTISTIIYQKWHLNIEENTQPLRIDSIHPEMVWSIDSEYYFLRVSFPKDKVITELINLAKNKCTLDECCTFTQRLVKEEVTIEDLEQEYSFSHRNNYQLYTLD